MVISTGITVPDLSSVAALYCLQNSMVWTPWGPRAVPTGGAGVAFPAGNWILTTVTTRLFAIADLSRHDVCAGRARLQLRHLGELELHRRLPAEDVHQHLELELVLVD